MTDRSSENIARLQTQNRRLAALAEFGFQLAQEPTPQSLFEGFCNGARDLLGCSYAILWIWNHEVTSDGFFVISGMDDAAMRSALVRPRADSQIFLRVLEERGTFQISNPGGSPQAGDLPPGYPGWRSGLVASIGSLDEVYGAICVFDKVDSERFDPDDERIVTILSAQVGRLYQNHTLNARARRQAEKLRESERRFDKIADSGDRISLILDHDGRITTCSDNLLAVTRWQWEEIAGRSWFDLFVPRETVAELKASHVALIQDVAGSKHQVYEILTRSGERRLVKWNHSVLRSSSGEVIGSASIGEDISEQRRTENWSLRLDRLGALRKSIADLAASSWNRDDLLRESCRLIVESGTFRMAWIGEIEAGVWCDSAVACQGGDEKSVEIAGFTARAGPLHSVRPPGMVARYGVPVIVEDIGAEPSLMPVRHALSARGNRAMACFPLVVGGQTAAVLVLYSSQPDVFHDVETRLLLELAGDISSALDKLKNPELRPYLAHFDSLTGLADSTLFHERLDLYFVSAQAKQEKLAVAVLGLERLKTVSATYGNHIRDSLINRFIERLRENISDETRLARLDENHFAIVISGLKPGEKVAEKLHEGFGRCFTEMYRIEEAELRLSATVGVGEYPGNGLTVDELLQNARVVRERIGAGVEGISGIIVATGGSTASEINLEAKLRRALDNEEFVLHYQPKIDLKTRRIEGFEALIRWMSPDFGLVMPGRIISLLEETGLILEIGNWALYRAAIDRKFWLDQSIDAPRIAVNISGVQLRQPDFVSTVAGALKAGAAPSGIDVEITESLLMEDIEVNIDKLHTLHALGVNLSIDDFGTGYSSLAYLAKIPAQILKINRIPVADQATSGEINTTLVTEIISLAHSLKMEVVAKGVEKAEEARLLRRLHCDQIQGYLISPPAPFEEITALLRPLT